MNRNYNTKTNLVFVTAILFLSVVTITNTSNTLMQQVLGSNHLVPDLPLTAEECKLDTNPDGPSCKPDLRNSAIVPDLPLTAEECKLDTNPDGPSCKPDRN